MGRRRQPQNEKLRSRISKSRHGSAPISPVSECTPLFSRYFFAIFDEPRTLLATDDFSLQDAQLFQAIDRISVRVVPHCSGHRVAQYTRRRDRPREPAAKILCVASKQAVPFLVRYRLFK